MNNIILETGAGDDFKGTSQKAKAMATAKQNVQFNFNGIMCVVSKKTDLDLFYRDYGNAFLMKWKTIGPDCVKEYSDEVSSEIEAKSFESLERRRLRAIEVKKEEDEKRTALEAKINGVEFDCTDKDLFDGIVSKNSDPYGAGIVSYATRWARLMQYEIANGKTIADVAKKASHEADVDGITGFMYGAAVKILSQCWAHGEELRVFHNADYGHKWDGVVNPAVLTIGEKKDSTETLLVSE